MIFEWDARKSAANLRKHGVRFEDAVEVFNDPYHLIECSYEDPVTFEPRWKITGIVPRLGSEVVVIYVNRDDDWKKGKGKTTREEIIRIISARKASSSESRRYQGS